MYLASLGKFSRLFGLIQLIGSTRPKFDVWSYHNLSRPKLEFGLSHEKFDVFFFLSLNFLTTECRERKKMRSERCVDHYFKNMFRYACNRLSSSAFGLIKVVVLKFGTCRLLQRAKSIYYYRYFVCLFVYVLRWTNFKALYNLSEHYVGVDTNYESVQADIVLLKQKKSIGVNCFFQI